MAGFRLFDLNPEQQLAVRTTEGPLLILAGAGSGKTRVITARTAFLISQGVPPENILAVTFTNKAANEMRERLATMVETEKAKKVTMSTFHALCVRVLRQDIEALGYKKNFSIYDEGDQLGLIKKIITRTAAQDEKLDAHAARNGISKAKNAGWSAPEDDKTLLGAVFARYNAELKTLNAVDFDDLLLLTVKLLNEHPHIRERWHRKYRYVMVDEFQDTNRLQLDLISLIAKSADPAYVPNVAVVGDDDQSIYGWRGADVSNILEFEAHFPNPTIVKLEQNYRSTNFILGTANSLIKNNPRRRAKKLWSDKQGGECVKIIAMPDDRQEAQFIAEEINARKTAEGRKWEDFAVLFRMNAQSRLVEQEFRRLRVPYRVIGGKSFFDRREIKDVLAYASCLLNVDDDVALLRIVNTPARGISDATVERAIEFSIGKKCSVFQAMRDEEFLATLRQQTQTAIAKFSTFLDDYETKLHEPLANEPAILRALIKESGYLGELQRTCKTPEEWLDRERNVSELIAGFERFESRSDKGMQGWLDEMMLRQEDEDDKEEDAAGVTLITLHASKGLEFPHVYLMGVEEGVIPHDRSKLEGTVDEERRLLYVGITRARETISLTWCRQRMKYGTPVAGILSSFIKEFDPALCEHKDVGQILNAPVAEEKAAAKFGAIFEMLGKL
jgi:DNA helicase II / ATP-dependent DNA helicase PcrA